MNLEKELQNKIDLLTKPHGSLGLLERTALKYGMIKNSLCPKLPENKKVFVFSGDHGITESGTSAYPKEVTVQMVTNFLNGGAAINVFSKHNNAEVFIVDAGVDYDFEPHKNLIVKKVGYGTKNFTKEKAMSLSDAEKSIKFGRDIASDAIKNGGDLFAIGDMGIGNTATATAICCAAGIPIDSIIDIGTVINSDTLSKKRELIKNAVEFHSPFENPIDIISKVGSYCIGEMIGFMLECTDQKVPFVTDGYPVTSAAFIAYKINPEVKKYMFAGHKSAVKGHEVLLNLLEAEPLLNLGMRLGEGTGAVLSFSIIEAAVKMLNNMASFESAGISTGDEL